MSISEKCEELNSTLSAFLESLDSRQQLVEIVRQLHHKVWSMNRNHSPIIQHRTGSRAENQTRIRPNGIQSDIDFMLEVDSIIVSGKRIEKIYFQPTSSDGYYGRILISDQYRDVLMTDTHLKGIFQKWSFKRDKFSNRFVLDPKLFRQNVLKASGFQYQQSKKPQSISPSIPGRGVVNEYDVVPCLRLNGWPEESASWTSRGRPLSLFDPVWREKVVESSPVFLVAAGEPNSHFQTEQFRASFSMLEIECFKKLPHLLRQLFGLAKYVFTCLISSVGLLSWFHVKYLLFWMVEKDEIDWNTIPPLCFLFHLMDSIRHSIREGTIRHFFLDKCNVFPEHRRTYERECAYDQILSDKRIVTDCVENLLLTELQLTNCNLTTTEIKNTESRYLSPNSYLDGYLTRLLSLIVFVGKEMCTNGTTCPFAKEVLEDCKDNKCTTKLVPILEMYFYGKVPEKISINSLAHGAFLEYMTGNIDECLSLCLQHLTCGIEDDCILGVTVTKYDRTPELDEPLRYALDQLQKKLGTCPRIYLHPLFFIKHALLQGELKKRDRSLQCIETLFCDLHNLSRTLSPRTPYCGLLSYQAVALLVIEGFNEYFKKNNIDIRSHETETSGELDFPLASACCSFDLQ